MNQILRNFVEKGFDFENDIVEIVVNNRRINFSNYLREIFLYLDIYNISNSVFPVSRGVFRIAIHRIQHNRKNELRFCHKKISIPGVRWTFRESYSTNEDNHIPFPFLWSLCYEHESNEIELSKIALLEFFYLQSYNYMDEKDLGEEDYSNDNPKYILWIRRITRGFKSLIKLQKFGFFNNIDSFSHNDRIPSPWRIKEEILDRILLEEKEDPNSVIKFSKIIAVWVCFFGKIEYLEKMKIRKEIEFGRGLLQCMLVVGSMRGTKVFEFVHRLLEEDQRIENQLINKKNESRLVRRLNRASRSRKSNETEINNTDEENENNNDNNSNPQEQDINMEEEEESTSSDDELFLESDSEEEDTSKDNEEIRRERKVRGRRRKFDFFFNANILIRTACRTGNIEVYNHLLALPDPKEYRKVTDSHNEAIKSAAKRGYLELVRRLIKDGANPQDNYNSEYRTTPITKACKYGHTEVVKMLLSDERVDPSRKKCVAFLKAVKKNRIEVVKVLLKDKRIDPSIKDNKAIFVCAKKNYIEMCKILLEDERVSPNDLQNRIFRICCKKNHFEIVKILVMDKRVDITDHYGQGFRKAYQKEYHQIIDLLSNDPRIKKNQKEICDFQIACREGNEEKVKKFVMDETFEIQSDENYGFIEACKHSKSVENVRLLINDSRIDPSSRDSKAIVCVCERVVKDVDKVDKVFRPKKEMIKESEKNRSDVEIAKLLLNDPRVNPSARENKALRKCRIEAIGILVFSDPRVSSSSKNYKALVNACENNFCDLVKIILNDPKRIVDAEDIKLLEDLSYGNDKILKILLEDGRFDPGVDNNSVIGTKVSQGDVESVRLLVNDPRVDVTSDDQYAFFSALDDLKIEKHRYKRRWRKRRNDRPDYFDILRLLIGTRKVLEDIQMNFKKYEYEITGSFCGRRSKKVF